MQIGSIGSIDSIGPMSRIELGLAPRDNDMCTRITNQHMRMIMKVIASHVEKVEEGCSVVLRLC